MLTLLNKPFRYSNEMRVVIALLYGFVTLTASLNHTCYSAKEDAHGHHLENSSCDLAEASRAGTRLTIALNQNSSDGKVLSRRQYCLACLYSLTSKFLKLNSAASLASVEGVVKIRFIHHPNFVRQFEWFSSAPLRAPPILTS
jgi:hypothetical protein